MGWSMPTQVTTSCMPYIAQHDSLKRGGSVAVGLNSTRTDAGPEKGSRILGPSDTAEMTGD